MLTSDNGEDPAGCGWDLLRHRVLPGNSSPLLAPGTPGMDSPARQPTGFLGTSATILRSISEIDDRRNPLARTPTTPQTTTPARQQTGFLGTSATVLRSLSQIDDRRKSLVRTPTPPRDTAKSLVRTPTPPRGTAKVAQAHPAKPSRMAGAVVSTGADPDVLKEMGNREFRKGRFAEAIAMYDRAIAVDGKRAAYWSNKAAALVELGRLLEAVEICKEAIRIDGSYFRAQHRLADLYLRLGDTMKAMHHYQLSGGESDSEDFSRLHSIGSHIKSSYEARKQKDWRTVLKEAKSAISEGADSAPQVFASQAEALLKLQRHEEVAKIASDAPAFDMESSTRFFGAPTNAYVLSVEAQVDTALGRFEEAVAKVERALRLDPRNKEVMAVSRRTRAMSTSWSWGNELFDQAKYREACAAFQEGLEHDPCNSVLLSSRAASHVKLDMWEEAIADYDKALVVRPSFSKARLQRADCYFQLKRWVPAIRDYEFLMKDGQDEKISSVLWEARFQLMKEKSQITNSLG